jgi:hypothetical protein
LCRCEELNGDHDAETPSTDKARRDGAARNREDRSETMKTARGLAVGASEEKFTQEQAVGVIEGRRNLVTRTYTQENPLAQETDQRCASTLCAREAWREKHGEPESERDAQANKLPAAPQ